MKDCVAAPGSSIGECSVGGHVQRRSFRISGPAQRVSRQCHSAKVDITARRESNAISVPTAELRCSWLDVKNYLATFNIPIDSNQADLRLDQNLTDKQQIYARFTYQNRRVNNAPYPNGTPLIGALT
jgi:hypothetical protein